MDSAVVEHDVHYIYALQPYLERWQYFWTTLTERKQKKQNKKKIKKKPQEPFHSLFIEAFEIYSALGVRRPVLSVLVSVSAQKLHRVEKSSYFQREAFPTFAQNRKDRRTRDNRSTHQFLQLHQNPHCFYTHLVIYEMTKYLKDCFYEAGMFLSNRGTVSLMLMGLFQSRHASFFATDSRTPLCSDFRNRIQLNSIKALVLL